MRFLVTLLVFVMVGPTIVGSLIIPLTDPSLGFDSGKSSPYLAAGGFLAAMPVSYLVAGMIMKRIEIPAAK